MTFTQTLDRILSISQACVPGNPIVQSRKVMVLNSTPGKLRKSSVIWRLRSDMSGVYHIVCRVDGKGFAHVSVTGFKKSGKLTAHWLDYGLVEGLEISENSLSFSLDLTKI